MIKLTSILKQVLREAEDAAGTWYHGSTADIQQSELDPLHRDSEKYKGDTDKQMWSRTGSSGGAVGIYFGKNPAERSPTGPLQYTGFDNTAAPYKQGFMYKMTLKPDANIQQDSALHNVGKSKYEELRKKGVDALVWGSELNVINPDAIASFTKVDTWRVAPALYPLIRGKRGEKIAFNNNEEMLNYLKKELGDYKLHKSGDKQVYLSTDENSSKGFEYSTDRKWDHGLVK